MADPRHDLGRRAEDACASWLTSCGWRVLARRYRPLTPGSGEVDIVATDTGGWLVGIEVRARTSSRTGDATATVDGGRVARVGHSLAAFAATSRGPHVGLRVDLVTAEPLVEAGRHRWRLRRLAGLEAGRSATPRRSPRAR